ncbi:hypothetical protein OE88DRAFT_1733520 [Heliocybe sulcata]|uniref:Uncharacterized protein n=1 Tax=Heliocybe sulcata TaxID=5364 RepID=A0A5C3NC96_9AGAM|nr:hypothetical protein OE88DRAFT_1733520 [Heliocybe sulcata]
MGWSGFSASVLLDGQVEITDIPGVAEEEGRRLEAIYEEALSKKLAAKFMASGGACFERYFMTVTDEQDGLGDCVVDTEVLQKRTGYSINIFMSTSASPGPAFTSRMFAPSMGIPGGSCVDLRTASRDRTARK